MFPEQQISIFQKEHVTHSQTINLYHHMNKLQFKIYSNRKQLKL